MEGENFFSEEIEIIRRECEAQARALFSDRPLQARIDSLP
jgi:hypothetical protein